MKLQRSLRSTIRNGFLFALATSLFLSGCKSSTTAVSGSGDDGLITFKFIQLNDVYEIAPLSGGQYGGMSRVAHVRDSIKAENPNTYMFMAGDFLNPSLLGTIKYEGERIRGKQMIEVMNAMEFDLVTFGNHEFDIDREDLQKRLNESEFKWMSSNVEEVTEKGNRPFTILRGIGSVPIPDTRIITMSDADGTTVKVGFLGVTLPSNPRDYVHYGDIYEDAESAYATLESQVDVVMGLTHIEVEQDMELAKRLPKIPFIMGGHEHNSMMVPEGNTIIAKADANAKTVYIHTLTYNKKTKDLKIDSHLMPIDTRTKSQPRVKAIVDRWNAILVSEIKSVIADPNEVIYTAATPLDGTDSASRGVQTNLGGIIAHAMALSFDEPTDGALVNGGSIRIDDMLSNEVTSMDIFRVLPFGGGVLKVDITGDLLIKVLDRGKEERGTGAYLQRYNFSQDGNGAWLIGGKLIDTNATYTIAFSDFLLRGFDIPFLTPENEGVLKVQEPNENEPANDIRKAVIVYLRSLNK